MKKIKDGAKWGDWKLDKGAGCLRLNRGKGKFKPEIPLSDIDEAGKLLSSVFHIRRKAWATNDIIGDLLSALRAIIKAQQSEYWGK